MIRNHSTSRCRFCRAPIYWTRTTSGRPMAVNAAPDPNGGLLLSDRDGVLLAQVVPASMGSTVRHRPHFATCPNAKDWR